MRIFGGLEENPSIWIFQQGIATGSIICNRFKSRLFFGQQSQSSSEDKEDGLFTATDVIKEEVKKLENRLSDNDLHKLMSKESFEGTPKKKTKSLSEILQPIKVWEKEANANATSICTKTEPTIAEMEAKTGLKMDETSADAQESTNTEKSADFEETEKEAEISTKAETWADLRPAAELKLAETSAELKPAETSVELKPAETTAETSAETTAETPPQITSAAEKVAEILNYKDTNMILRRFIQGFKNLMAECPVLSKFLP